MSSLRHGKAQRTSGEVVAFAIARALMTVSMLWLVSDESWWLILAFGLVLAELAQMRFQEWLDGR